MPISFDSALGIHQQALAVRARRAEHLASNIANADTPGYKARDIDFRQALSQAQAVKGMTVARTHSQHISLDGASGNTQTLYRIPYQPSLDGNTVDAQIEKSEFADNALRYQASLSFLDGKFKGLIRAIKGE